MRKATRKASVTGPAPKAWATTMSPHVAEDPARQRGQADRPDRADDAALDCS